MSVVGSLLILIIIVSVLVGVLHDRKLPVKPISQDGLERWKYRTLNCRDGVHEACATCGCECHNAE